MIERVSDHMRQGCVEFVQDVPVHLGIKPANFDLGLLAQLLGHIANHFGESLDPVTKRRHSAKDHLPIQTAVKVVRLPGVFFKGPHPFGEGISRTR